MVSKSFFIPISNMNTIFTHKSIRRFKSIPVEKDVITCILEAGVRASNTGNMQVYSMVVTTNEELLQRLGECHFNQPASKAPLQITFCADYNRFNKWCAQRNAKPGFDNFLSFLVGSCDAFLAAQNVCLAAEEKGLGACYLGTVMYNTDKIIDILKLPKGVVPVATLVLGYPDESPGLTDRLPLEGVVHWETYKDYTTEDIDRVYLEKESSDLTKSLLEQNKKETLAQIFTDNRYPKKMNEDVSEMLMNILKKQGFLQ
jgi:nitroreductase